ncbi:TetR/AcrR family transcriptional regulator [Aliamphritea hakodatensis]|uniref:TetR/AcrR family transcriptional regulator n=1 Tax=Aliamphritea hakodatensis TaxID=2895352 RepID=UPI0022FD7DA1|nr:TetR/AcrR family transcriptional regulator [Aliamphritea hakodatensis]
MVKSVRNPHETKKKILEAALEEFSEYGFYGARVDRIVQSAGVNKRMVYHYFHDKTGLFEALINAEIVKMSEVAQHGPVDSLVELSRYWLKNAGVTKDYYRLLMASEAVSGDDIMLKDEHDASYRYSKNIYSDLLQDKDVDPAYFLLAMVSITSFPIMMPGLAKLITGDSVETTEFGTAYEKALLTLLEEKYR